MAFRNWRIGMHIQQDHIAIVALLLERSRWALRRWWSIPLMPGTVRQGIVVDVESLARQLQPWRRELPLQHQACIAFPAARTLQKQLPRPQISLRESEQATWIASAMAQQLEMPASSLCVDYVDARAVDGWRVTAAQRLDINVLGQLASRLKLKVVGIVPDASALGAFFPWQPDDVQGLAWRDEASWLWATADSWGCCPCSDVPSFPGLVSRVNAGEFRLCASASPDGQNFDAWSAIHRLQPPLPARGDSFTIALGLALGARQS
ncbi:pilus assembly protein [Klebsiella michiganensis]|uniref:pilus assembly protein n=1 Tax=Klebsiella michiganensis TaxID=1134687 RepID=UPI0029275B6F|nr:pilus assembly protein [Klebsiella michiganensis]ELT1810379.1 pilus assembly protein [Klebsiella michiganensis]MDV0341371.1 pilus assembly protein [Klebsiella michiganensis]MDV0357028.1 pilus assembly protein [Klebsiella michiganensis]MDV0405159.1 pilus assembly protein [Klebsiella michiganensis]